MKEKTGDAKKFCVIIEAPEYRKFSRILNSVLAEEYGKTGEETPNGIRLEAKRRDGIDIKERYGSANDFSFKISGPLEIMGKVSEYLSNATEKYFQEIQPKS